jgi:hypothetical protein
VEHYRALWSAVILQTIHDIETAPLDSVEHADAVAFFTGGGDWLRSRRLIAEAINLHEDDLTKLGRRLVLDRRRSEGLPDEPPPRRKANPPMPQPLPPLPPPVPLMLRPLKMPPLFVAQLPVADGPPPPPKPKGRGRKRWTTNPFEKHLKP